MTDDAIVRQSRISEGDTVRRSGFVGIGTPEELITALERRFIKLRGRETSETHGPVCRTARSATDRSPQLRSSPQHPLCELRRMTPQLSQPMS
jgi:predicted metal-dependent phosphotriesterase family hydrolase